MKLMIKNCARCGGDHIDMKFDELIMPIGEYTHFSLCPTTHEPVLMKIWNDDSAADQGIETENRWESLPLESDES